MSFAYARRKYKHVHEKFPAANYVRGNGILTASFLKTVLMKILNPNDDRAIRIHSIDTKI